MWKLVLLGTDRLKMLSYKIDTFYAQSGALVLINYNKDCLIQYKDNITEWDMGNGTSSLGLPMGQHYEVKILTHTDISVRDCTNERLLRWGNLGLNTHRPIRPLSDPIQICLAQ